MVFITDSVELDSGMASEGSPGQKVRKQWLETALDQWNKYHLTNQVLNTALTLGKYHIQHVRI